MIQMQLSAAAALLNTEILGDDVQFTGLCTDTRKLSDANLFVALKGPNFDGNDYAEAALSQGAAAALVTRPLQSTQPCIVVSDPRAALGTLSASWRDRFDPICIGITGSNGKTTVKDMLAAILAREHQVLANEGNLNNDIGLPLTLARLTDKDQYLITEMGANHVGEIAALAGLAKPVLGIITLIAPAHLEGFGSIDAIARAKGELLQALPSSGLAIVNADGDYQDLWKHLCAETRLLRFGFSADADVVVDAQLSAASTAVRLKTPAGEIEINLPLAGRHNAMNAAAATCAALALQIPTEQIIDGLESMQPVHGRLQPRRALNGMRILDDSYNASPQSLRAGLEVLAAYPAPRCLIFADMLELGEEAEAAHCEAGRLARVLGIEHLFATGPLSLNAAIEFGEGAQHFSDQTQLIKALGKHTKPEMTILIKGSRSMHMENVVRALTGDRPCC